LFKKVKHHTHKKKARMTTPIFTEFLRAFIDVEGRNILLLWITAPLIHKIHHCVLYTDLHKHILYLDWTGLNAAKMLTQVLMQLLIKKLPHMVFPAWKAA
jgi:hypothetical protein